MGHLVKREAIVIPVRDKLEEGEKMCRIAFNIPNEVLYDTRQSEEEALQFARRFTALSYYVHRGVSLGYAAQIADMDKEGFIKFLGENGVSIFRFDNEAAFLEELSNA